MEPLQGSCRADCLLILEEIQASGFQKDTVEFEKSLRNERIALEFTMTHFEELHQQGIFIRVAGRPVGFSIYEQVDPNTAAVHFEKAVRRFKGMYQIINQETAKAILAQDIKFINREEDLDIPGLRRAKLSYGPVEICPVHTLRSLNASVIS